MRKSILIIAISFTVQFSFGQNFNQLDNYEFATVESYKTEEPKVLMCANYLFNTPANQSEFNRLTSIQYIMKWMTGTPDYSFDIGESAVELTKGNDNLLGLYFAAMSKVVLENEGETLSKEDIYNRSEKMLVNYCVNSDNKMKPSSKIKKLLKSRNN